MNEKVILLVGVSADEAELNSIESVLGAEEQLKVNTLPFAEFEIPTEGTLYLLYLSDTEIKQFFEKVKSKPVSLALLPNAKCPYAIRNYGISSDMTEAIEDALKGENEAIYVDLLECNGVIVFGNIVIGNVHGMNRARNERKSYLKRISAFLSNLTHLSFQSYTITTAKGNVTNTAATGIMIFEHNVSGVSHNLLHENLSLHDGSVHALVLAPTSVAGYLYYLFLSYFLNKIVKEQLPKSIGLLASSGFEISSPRPIEYILDGELLRDSKLNLEVVQDAVSILLGRNIVDIPSDKEKEEEKKETIRVQGLPKGEQVNLLISEPIPFLPRASEEDFKDLFIGLRESAKVSSVFIVLIVLSTLLSTTGLFQNSTPVIIGAMILAPLMAPIVSFAMGVVRSDRELLNESLKTLWIGIFTALAFSCLYTYLMPLHVITDEMRSRLNPNILDLMVAIVSGIAGAYAYAKSEVAKSLAGVAIAVALVPPLSVTGIGIGWWDREIIYGSFLLFLTNLAGITLFAALTFIIMGFAPVKRATKGIVLSTLFLLIVTVPLFVSFFKVIEQNKIFTQLQSVRELVLNGRTVEIQTLSVDLSREQPLVYIKTRSGSVLNEDELQKIKVHINTLLKEPVVLDVLSEIEL